MVRCESCELKEPKDQTGTFNRVLAWTPGRLLRLGLKLLELCPGLMSGFGDVLVPGFHQA